MVFNQSECAQLSVYILKDNNLLTNQSGKIQNQKWQRYVNSWWTAKTVDEDLRFVASFFVNTEIFFLVFNTFSSNSIWPFYAADYVVSLTFSSSHVKSNHGRKDDDDTNKIEDNNDSSLWKEQTMVLDNVVVSFAAVIWLVTQRSTPAMLISQFWFATK